MAKMSDDDLLSICKRESEQAESYIASEVAGDREKAMERYFGEKYGDEVAGRSSVVTMDVLETVEWVMPALLRIFVSGDDVVTYEPEGPEDEEGAKQCTDLANHVFNKDNNGFLIFMTWFKDAILQKMGVVKSHWTEEETSTTTSYTGLTEQEFLQLIMADDVEVTEHTERYLDGSEVADGFLRDRTIEDDDVEIDEMGPTTTDVTITVTKQKNRIKIDNIPPEEFFMSFDAADPDSADYLEHRVLKTHTQLITEGFSKKVVEGLPSDSTNDPTGERQARMGQQVGYDEHADEAMAEVTVHESYVYADTNDDGVAEWTKVIWVGDQILESEPVSAQPFSTITPIPVPHRAYGLSLADLLIDISRIRTVILRQTLDSLYLANNPEREVDINKIVDMDDFLTTRPGGIKRVEEIGASREIAHPFVAQHSFAMMDGLDMMSARRTGVSDSMMAVNADVLSNVNSSVDNNAVAAKNQRVEMIARIFAETGVKHLFRRILQLLIENQDKPRTVRLRNEWVQMDPSNWSPDMDVTIDVGLGHGNRDQQVGHLNNILIWQKEMLGAGGLGMVRPKHVYNTMARIVTTIGFKSPDQFMDDPGDEPMPQQQQANPQAELIQAQMQIEQGKAQVMLEKARLEDDTKDQKHKLDHHAAMQKLEIETERLDIEREKIVAQMNQTAAKIRSDEAKAAAILDAQAQAQMERID